MDDQRLRELFQDAVRDVPPASFGRDEVVAASRRAAVRRRGVLVGATAFGVVLVVGGLLAGGQVLRDQLPSAQPHVLSGPTPRAEPGCGPADERLAVAAAAALADRNIPVTGPAREASGPCPDGTRSAALPVSEGSVQVLLLPGPDTSGPGHSVALDDGRVLVVLTVPEVPGEPDPLADELPGLAEDLAARV